MFLSGEHKGDFVFKIIHILGRVLFLVDLGLIFSFLADFDPGLYTPIGGPCRLWVKYLWPHSTVKDMYEVVMLSNTSNLFSCFCFLFLFCHFNLNNSMYCYSVLPQTPRRKTSETLSALRV